MHRKKNQCDYGYWLSFAIPAVLMFLILILRHVFPFGNATIVSEDMKNQYLSIITYLRNNLAHPENFLYSYQISLGGNFFAVLTYYLVCPFNLLSLLFPVKYMPLFYAINTLVDVGLIGLTTYTYFKKSIFINEHTPVKHLGYVQWWRVFFATIYPLSAFFANYLNCVMWLNASILMPLVTLGLDYILYQKKAVTWVYWISLVVLLITNYYIGVIVLVFMFVLTVFWMIDQICQFQWHIVLKKGLLVLMLTILSILSTAVIMWPSYLAQQDVAQAKIEANNFKPVYEFKEFWGALLDGQVAHHPGPLIFAGLLILVLFLAFFFSSKINLREKILAILMTALFIASSYFTYLYMIWHSLSLPNGYFQRESFIFTFFMLALAYKGLTIFENHHPLFFLTIIIIMIAITMVIVQKKYNIFKPSEINAGMITLLLILGSCPLTLINPKIGMSFLMGIGIVNIFVYNNNVQKKAFSEMPQDAYTKAVTENQTVYNKLKEYDSSFYRVGSTAQINQGDPMLYGYNGVESYLSQQPTLQTDYLSALGFYQKLGWIRWSEFNNGSTGAINDMLGIKYVVQSDKTILKETQKIGAMPTYNNRSNVPDLVPVLKSKHTIVYENPNAFPLAFGANNGKGNSSIFNGLYFYNPEDNPFILYNWLFKRIGGKTWLYNMQQTTIKYNKSTNTLIIRGVINQSGDIYGFITNSRNVMQDGNADYMPIFVNGKEVARYGNKNQWGENGIIYLGNFKQGNPIVVQIKNVSEITKKSKFYMASENQQMRKRIRQKAIQGITNIKVDGPNISFKTTSQFKQRRLVLTIPYDKTWKVKIDGEMVHHYRALGDLTAIKLKPGAHNITLHYVVPGLKEGMIVSLIAMILLSGYELFKLIFFPKKISSFIKEQMNR